MVNGNELIQRQNIFIKCTQEIKINAKKNRTKTLKEKKPNSSKKLCVRHLTFDELTTKNKKKGFVFFNKIYLWPKEKEKKNYNSSRSFRIVNFAFSKVGGGVRVLTLILKKYQFAFLLV